MAVSEAQLNELIRDAMQQAWIDNEPTPECIDFSVANTEAAMAFRDGAENEPFRLHLLGCVRCHFLYTTL